MPPGLASFHVFTVAARILNIMHGALPPLAGTVVSLALWSVSSRKPVFCFVSETASTRVAHAGLELVVVLLPLSLRMDAGMTNVSYNPLLYVMDTFATGKTLRC